MIPMRILILNLILYGSMLLISKPICQSMD